MSAIPITLSVGQIAIYGMGTAVSPSGIANTTANGVIKWGTVSQVWPGGETYIYGNDNVMFNENDVVCRLSYNDYPYTIVPARLATKQEPLL